VKALLSEHALADRVEHWSRGNVTESPTVRQAAVRFETTPRNLDRVLEARMGLSFRKYHRGVKLIKALELLVLEDVKVEAVPGLVGFKSRKAFYDAFQKWYGATPGALKVIAPDRASVIHQRLPSCFRSEAKAIFRARELAQSIEGPRRTGDMPDDYILI
jgi:transcriptional regulator GlxA family with amidase domain